MNKHRLGVSHRRGGLFYRLYFITVCHLHGGMLIASCDYLHIWKSTSICHVPPISHESVPPSPDEQLLFIHKVTGSARAWRHLHLTSCRLTYVNPATSAHVHTENISPCRVTPHRKKKKIPTPSPSPCFLKVTIYTMCFGPLWRLRVPRRSERIHTERHLCQMSKSLSILISQKGIMRLITYIVF